MTPERWDWDTARGPARLIAELGQTGIAWIRAPELAEAAAREPWACAERLMGERVLLLERQPIRAVPGGRSFSSGHMAAPFHTDSQTLLGVPPHVQVMACLAAAAEGGESLYLDTWALLERIEGDEPDLLASLFLAPRRMPFVFGDVFAPTVVVRGGSLVFTHTPRPPADDPVAARLRPYVESAPVIEVRAAPGDILLIHNHRMLHGRRVFDDESRSFTRLLIWRAHPFPAPRRWMARAQATGAPVARGDVGHRLGVVLEMLRGVPPGVLSAREGVPEPEIYAWRDAVLRGAATALAEDGVRATPSDSRPPDRVR